MALENLLEIIYFLFEDFCRSLVISGFKTVFYFILTSLSGNPQLHIPVNVKNTNKLNEDYRENRVLFN